MEKNKKPNIIEYSFMYKAKVTKITPESIVFNDTIELYSNHDSDCCESHYLSMEDLTLEDFDGLEFDLSNDNFFNRIEGYGIELVPVSGHSVKIPGYGFNNGYYSDNLDLILFDTNKRKTIANYDITECQSIEG